MIQILLVDDDTMVRRGLRMRLALEKDVQVVGEANDGQQAVEMVKLLKPDAVVMDVVMPNLDGVAATKAIHQFAPQTCIIILSLHSDETTRARVCAAGATAFLTKGENEQDLVPILRQSKSAALPMQDFYNTFYAAVEQSHAHAKFCEYAYGKNLCQHGFVTMAQLAALIEVTGLNAASCALDLGCGNGMIAEYLAEVTGAHVTGLDYIPSAIAQAQKRTESKCPRLEFIVGDLTQPNLPIDSFNTVLSLDTIYFSDDYAATIRRWRALVRSGGHLAIFYSHGANPQIPKNIFRRETLPLDKTPLADALKACGLEFQTWDFTQQDYELAQRKKEILEQWKAEFEAEGNSFLYENRIGETLGVLDAIDSQMHARYLYLIQV